jgi:hypothetical protein
MAPQNVDYSKTVIYKICCNNLNVQHIYIGHTTDFTRRKSNHKSNCNHENSKHYNYNVYQFIRENGGWDNWSMVEIEKYQCNDGNEATARERYWVEQLHATLNSNVPGRTQQEYDQQYYQQNKEKITEYKQQYREQNSEKIKEYFQQNSEKIKQWKNTQCKCECGGKFTLANKSKHLKSKMHQNLININNN